jgi:hypothetical protein
MLPDANKIVSYSSAFKDNKGTEILMNKIDTLMEYVKDSNGKQENLLDNLAKQFDTIATPNNFSKLIFTKSDSDIPFSNERENTLNEIDLCIKNIEENFDDIAEKLTYFSIIKDQLKKLKSYVDKDINKYYYRACIIEHDSILHLKSEYVTKEQFNAIKYVIKKLNNLNIDKMQFDEIDDVLVENGLDWIPECE